MKKSISAVLLSGALALGMLTPGVPVYASSYDDAIHAYANFLYEYVNGQTVRFGIVNLYDNNTPTLFISTPTHAVSNVEFFAYDGSSVYSLGCCIADCGLCNVAEGDGYIEGYYTGSGSEEYIFYCADEEEVYEIAAMDSIKNYGNGSQSYEIDGSTVSEDEYYDAILAYEDGYTFTEIGNSNCYTLTEDNIEYFRENPSKFHPSKNNSSGSTTMYVVNCNEWISLRTSPSTSASVITTIPLGAKVTYISSASNGFYQISYGGNTGYALASYLSTKSSGSSSSGSSSSGSSSSGSTTMYVVNCNEWISLRTSPNTSASVITTIPLGSKVTYISTASNGFYKISYNGYTGYSLSQYLQ